MRFLRLALGLTTALTVCAAGTATTTLSAAPRDGDEGDRPYLALGDSVPFGFITQAGFEYVNADNFVGYPEYIARALRLDPAEASCPGETSGSFLSSSAADNGCHAYRANAPLHVTYTSTQLRYASSFLKNHRETQLVTIGLGANDLFLLETSCGGDPACISAHLPEALASIGANMETILSSLRATGFRRTIVVANYYSLDYSDVAGTGITALLNQALGAAAAANGAVVADIFTAFQAAVSNPFAAGSSCRAGLLNALPANQFLCDVHPSQSGQRLIAETVEHAARRGMRNETD
jgi:lysophospholipase L1-like esterase